MNILHKIKDELKLDFSSTTVELDFGDEAKCPFEISPRDFLRFAKSDLKEDDFKGLINALTNAKRAIDCQIDSALKIFGIDYDKIPTSSNKIIELTESNKNLPYKLKLIKSLGFAPGGLISKTRNLRNKLEHYYKTPKKQEVIDALELAELFILSMESHLKLIDGNFIISDKHNWQGESRYQNLIFINFELENPHISIKFYKDNVEIDKLIFNQNDEIYYLLILLINNIHEKIDFEEALGLMLKYIDHPIPQKNINVDFVM